VKKKIVVLSSEISFHLRKTKCICALLLLSTSQMPLPVIAFIVIGIGVAFIGGSGSVLAVSLLHNIRARRRLRGGPNGRLRAPRGMTRDELKEAAQERLGMNVTQYFNFVFCGECGAGEMKSYCYSL
jgi:hypothetical protein